MAGDHDLRGMTRTGELAESDTVRRGMRGMAAHAVEGAPHGVSNKSTPLAHRHRMCSRDGQIVCHPSWCAVLVIPVPAVGDPNGPTPPLPQGNGLMAPTDARDRTVLRNSSQTAHWSVRSRLILPPEEACPSPRPLGGDRTCPRFDARRNAAVLCVLQPCRPPALRQCPQHRSAQRDTQCHTRLLAMTANGHRSYNLCGTAGGPRSRVVCSPERHQRDRRTHASSFSKLLNLAWYGYIRMLLGVVGCQRHTAC